MRQPGRQRGPDRGYEPVVKVGFAWIDRTDPLY